MKKIILIVVSLMALWQISAFAAVPTSGMVSHWNFDEGVGNVVSDTSGNSWNGVATSPVWNNSSLKFNGSSTSIDFGSIPSGFNSAKGITVSAWINTNLISGERTIFSIKSNGTVSYFLKVDGSGKLFLKARNSNGTAAGIYGGTTLSTNTWYHVVGVVDYSVGTLNIYVNGVNTGFGATGVGVTGSHYTGGTAVLGVHPTNIPSSDFFSGIMDDFYVYNRALSSAEAMDIYNSYIDDIKVNNYTFYKDQVSPLNAINSIEEGNILAQLSVANNSKQEKTFALIIALFNKDKLQNIKIRNESISIDEIKTIISDPLDIALSDGSVIDDYSIKIMLWDNMKPLVDDLELQYLYKDLRAIEIKPDVNTNAGNISPLIYGTGFEFNAGMIKARLNDVAMTNIFKEDGIKLIRFPNGTSALHYIWNDPNASYGSGNNGIPDINGIYPPPPLVAEQGHSLHTDEVVQFCKSIGAELVLQVNTYSYSYSTKITLANINQAAADAANWVEYCNAPNDGSNINGGTDWAALRSSRGHNEPYNVKYWEIGNEDWVYWSPTNFRLLSDAFAQKMKEVDPTIKIIYTGVNVYDGYSPQDIPSNGITEDWYNGMLENGTQNADYISNHSYFDQRRLFYEDFSKGNTRFSTSSSGWGVINPATDTRFLQNSLVNGCNYAWVTDLPNISNYSLVTRVSNRNYDQSSLGNAGVVFNRKDDQNYNISYIAQNGGETQLVLAQVVSGIRTVLATYSLSSTVNLATNYYIKVDTDGVRIRAKAWNSSDGKSNQPFTQIDVLDTTPNKFGSVGVITMENSTASFDDFSIFEWGSTIYDNFDGAMAEGWTKASDNSMSYIGSVEDYSDIDARVQITDRDGNSGIAFGLKDDKNYYLAYVDGISLKVDKVTDGVKTNIGSIAYTSGQNVWLKLQTQVYGSSTKVLVKAWENNTGALEPDYQLSVDISDEAVIGKVGLFGLNSKYNNFAITRRTSFYDYFDSDNGKWTKNNGSWDIISGSKVQSSTVAVPSIAYLNGFDDTTKMTAKVKITNRNTVGKAGIAFNITSNGQDYYFAYADGSNKITLARVNAGNVVTTIGHYTLPTAIDTTLPIYLKVNLNQGIAFITMWQVGNVEPTTQLRVALNIYDSGYISKGKVGIATMGGATANFDNFELFREGEQLKSDVKAISAKVVTDPRLGQASSYIASNNSSAKIFESEYNFMALNTDTLRYYSLQNYAQAVMVADYIGQMINNGVEMASLHVSMGPEIFRMYDPYTYGATLETTRKQIITYAFKMFSNYFGDVRLNSQITNMEKYPHSIFDVTTNKLETKALDVVSVYTSKNTKTNMLEIVLVNKDTENAKSIKVDLTGIERKNTQGKLRKLGENNPIDAGNLTSANNTVITEEMIDVSDNFVNVLLLAHTIMDIEIPLY